MQEKHYLPFNGFRGRSIRHIAEYEGEWLALIGWQEGAYKLKPRDEWIGWPPERRLKRLHLIAQNARFLVLYRIPNLASRVLSLSLARLSQDTYLIYGYKVYVAETFVDPSRFKGTCYKACGWTSLGMTKGFSRTRYPNSDIVTWKKNNSPKEIFVKTMTLDATDQISGPDTPEGDLNPEKKEVREAELKSLHDYFSKQEDHRHQQGKRYSFAFLMTIIVCARLCGHYGFRKASMFGKSLTDAQLETLGAYYSEKHGKHVAPCHGTYQHFLSKMDGDLLQKTLRTFFKDYSESNEAIAIDGKSMKAASKKSYEDHGSHTMNVCAFEQNTGIVLDQEPVQSKGGEMAALRAIIKRLHNTGRVYTMDALHSQHNTAKLCCEEGVEYVFTAIKGNQAKIKEELEDLEDERAIDYYETTDTGHGRIDKRQYLYFDLLGEDEDICPSFEGSQLAVRVYRTSTNKKTGKTTKSVSHAITSLGIDEGKERIAGYIRNHWGIENSLHYIKDVSCKEDKARVYKKDMPSIISQINNLTISIINLKAHELEQYKSFSDKQYHYSNKTEAALDLFLNRIQKAQQIFVFLKKLSYRAWYVYALKMG